MNKRDNLVGMKVVVLEEQTEGEEEGFLGGEVQ